MEKYLKADFRIVFDFCMEIEGGFQVLDHETDVVEGI